MQLIDRGPDARRMTQIALSAIEITISLLIYVSAPKNFVIMISQLNTNHLLIQIIIF